MAEWKLHKEYDITGLENTVRILDSAIFHTNYDSLAGHEAKRQLDSHGSYDQELFYEALRIGAQRVNSHCTISVFYKNDDNLAKKLSGEIESRL